ncbi:MULTISPECIES: GAF domain-containing protein [Priestia]|uniref:STAS domain-containing protein n=2 Tax=Priestia TaxID=2800373 RepID=A0AAX6BM21_PRIMG|nr:MULTISPECIES: GAF domain-containing protein [Priestia]MBK0294543.1 GAF domain-containing protein [Bacillus sp. S34]NHH96339.1 RsbT co-antagonist protein RsbRD [Bacillus sp. MB95]UPK51888.1 GAF domain-containing protein [Bacillus sp. H8-1]AWD68039.1 anti-anti-sigma factor [Priestia megaterium]MBY0211855.1 GAF domain-containing protein [Priestia aryabhattai]
MNVDGENKVPHFYSLRSVSQKLFEVITKQLNVSTTYVTRRGETAMTVLSSYNEKEEIIPEGYSVEYGGTYCRLIIMNDGDVMHTANLMKDAVTRQLEVTDQLQVKGFLGVTLKDLKGNVFGTLCVMDKEEKEFSGEDIAFLQSMAGILSHMIDLDETRYQMGFLSVPIIPITEGVSILSLQGIIDKERADQIMTDVLHDAAHNEIDYFIIDLSKLLLREKEFPNFFLKMITALQLMGAQAVITGVTPTFAKEQTKNHDLRNLQLKVVKNIQQALQCVGYNLIKT